MRWSKAHRADRDCLPIADRHYNRQKVGSPQFVPLLPADMPEAIPAEQGVA